MTPPDMEARIVRYGDLMPCKTAFIDAHMPGSDQKENFTIIDGGVSESADQHVHIAEAHGFNIGAAGHGMAVTAPPAGTATLAQGDTMSVPADLDHSVVPSMTGEAALYHVTDTDDPAGATWSST